MKNKRILSLVLAFAMLLGTFSFAFADEAVAQTENEKVLKLVELGLVEGDAGTGNLRLDDPIKRAEVAKMVVVAMDKKDVADSVAGVKTFPDVLNAPSEKWANGYINVAYSEGIVNGYPDGTFRPGNHITKAEVVSMMVRVLGGLTEEEAKLAVGPNWATIYLAKAKDLGILEGIDLGNANETANREEVFELVFNTLTSKHGNLLIANTVEGIVVENYRTERLAKDEITVHVMKDQVQREGKYYEKDDEFNIRITPELKKKGLDVETLLGQVVSVSFDKEGKVVGIDPIKGYTYVQGGVNEIRDKEIKVAGRWYTIGKDEGRTTTVDERLYQVYLNNEDLHYYDDRDFDKDGEVVEKPRSFAGKALADDAPEYARLTVRNGKVLFIDAFEFKDIAPVAKDINKNSVEYYDDTKDGEVLDLTVRDSAYVITFEDGKMKLGSNEDIEENDVIHWYTDARDNLTVFVRPFADNKVEGVYKDVSARAAKDEKAVAIKVDDEEYDAYVKFDTRNAVYSYSKAEAEFYTLSGDYDEELAPFEKEEVVLLRDMFGFVQSITAEKVDGSFYALVSDTSRSHGDIKLVRADNTNEWYKTDRNTKFNTDGDTKDKQFDKFRKYDLVKASLKDEELITDLNRLTKDGEKVDKINSDIIDFGDDFFYIGKKTVLFVADDLKAMTVAQFRKNYKQDEDIEAYVITHARDKKLAEVIVITKATPVEGKTEDLVAKVTRVRIEGNKYQITVNAPYGKELREDVTKDTLLVTDKAAQKLLTDREVVAGSVVKITVTKDDKQNVVAMEELLDEKDEPTFKIVELERDRARNENYIVLEDAAGERSKTIWVSRLANTFYDYRKGDVVAIGEVHERYSTIDLLDVRSGKATGYLDEANRPKEEKEGKELKAIHPATNTVQIDGKLYAYAGDVNELADLVGKKVTFKTQEVNEKEYVFDIVEVEKDKDEDEDDNDEDDGDEDKVLKGEYIVSPFGGIKMVRFDMPEGQTKITSAKVNGSDAEFFNVDAGKGQVQVDAKTDSVEVVIGDVVYKIEVQ